MVSIVIDEVVLRQLSPAARREVLRVVGTELSRLRAGLTDIEWDPEGDMSYPLTVDEAKILVRGLQGAPREILRTFAQNFDGDAGHGELHALLAAAKFSDYRELGEEISRITAQMQSVAGQSGAWLFNWDADDWAWDAEADNYAKGAYYISGPAIHTLREAFGIE